MTDEERAKGLMDCKEVPEGYGMLFDFKQLQMVTMWMKNTYVSPDMIFIKNDGRIARIADNTTVLSEDIISSASRCARCSRWWPNRQKYGIAPGDKVAHPIFNAR